MGKRINTQKNSSTMTSKAQQVSTPLLQTRPFSDSASSSQTEVVQSKQSSFNFNFLNIPTHAPTQPGQIQQQEEEKEDRELSEDNRLQMQSGDGTIPYQKPLDSEEEIQTKSISGDREFEQEQENAPLQTKLTVGQPGDKYEQEADNMAAQVMAMPDSAIQAQKEPQTQEIQASHEVNNITRLVQHQIQNKEKIQAKPGLQRTVNSSSLESNLASSKGGGSALPDSVRSFMEPRFGADFSGVRVHTDSNAVQMNKDLGAAAFAHGNDIYYGAGKSPGNNELTAHELTHTIQQTGGLRLNKQISRKVDKEESIAAKQLSISPSPVTDNKELSLKPELEQTSTSVQAKQLTNYSPGENKGSIQRQPSPTQVNPRIQGNSAGGIEGTIASAARRIPGYELLALILGKDPVSGTSVERNPTNLIRTLLSLVPNGSNIFQNLEQSGALQRAFNWFNQEIKKLNLSWDTIKGLFSKALQSLGLADIFNPSGAVKKVENIFIQPIVRIKNFAVAAGTKVMEFAFEGFLNMAGGAGAKVMSIIRNAGGAIANIVKDPVGFGGNLVAGVKGGFQKFASNMPTHLKNGMTGWLLGAMAGAGLALPFVLDLKGIVSLVLQVLGLTYEKLRVKLVKLIGEPRVTRLEQAFDFLKTIVTGGLAAAWQKISEFAGDLQEMVIGSIRSWVQNTIITAAIARLISMFNPAGAIVQAVMAIYNTIMFFVERGSQIAALSEAVFASIGNIAAGNVALAANFVEIAMARSLPVMISFLARLIGLGGISEQIKNVIKKIQAPIDNAMNKLAGFVVDKSKSLLLRGEKITKPSGERTTKGTTSSNNEKSDEGQQGKQHTISSIEEKLTTEEGHAHTLFFKGKGSDTKLQIASTPEHISVFLTRKETEVNSSSSYLSVQEKATLLNHIKNARSLVQQIEGLTYPPDQNAPIPTALERQVNTLLKKLAKEVRQIDFTAVPVSPVSIIPGFSSSKAIGLKVQYLLKGQHQDGTPAEDYRGTLHGAAPILKSLNVRHKWVAFHLLNENTGGLAVDSNLIPAPQYVNKNYYEAFETQWKSRYTSNEVLWMDVTLSYRDEYFVQNISVKGGKMRLNKKNKTWELDKTEKIPDWNADIPQPATPSIRINNLPSDDRQRGQVASLASMEKGLLVDIADNLSPNVTSKDMLIRYIEQKFADDPRRANRYINQIQATDIDFSRD